MTMGALGGILIADCWIVRPSSSTWATCSASGGGTPIGTASTCVRSRRSCSPSFLWYRASSAPSRSRAAGSRIPNLLDHLYSYAWFVTFALSFVSYLLFMRGERATVVSQRAP